MKSLHASRFTAILLACLAVAFAQAASFAQSGGGLKGDYFSNNSVTGSPTLSRTDTTIDFDFGGGAPDAALPSDNFSVRWTGFIQPQYAETYTFYTNSDDGIRMWIDGMQVINNWTGHPPTEDSGVLGPFQAEKLYNIVIEYQELSGGAVAQLSWASASQSKQIVPTARLFKPGTGLKGDYFSNNSLTGTSTLSRTDAGVNFDWQSGSPDASLPSDNFSARWTGQVVPLYSQTYTFYTNSDDGVRLWVNGVQIIDNWTGHAPTENSGTITLNGYQPYDIKMEYQELSGGATAQLSWSSSNQAKQIVPADRLFPTTSTGSSTPLTVGNFGFESPTLAAGTYQDTPSGASWTFPSDAGIARNGSSFTLNNSNAPEGSQVAFIHNTGSFQQSISGFVAGKTYTITFSAAERNYSQSAQTWNLKVDGTVVGTFSPAQSATSYTDYSAQFSTVGGAFVVAFSGNATGDSTVLIDNIRITAEDSPNGPPSAPTGLAASASSSTSIALTWTDTSSNDTGYQIDRKIGSGGTYSQQGWAGANSTGYLDTNLAPGTLYYYRVRTENPYGVSGNSNEAYATTQNPVAISIANLGFEAPSLGGGNFQYTPSGTSWNMDGTAIAANGSGFTYANSNAPEGTQVAAIQGGYISQQLSGFVTGATYTLTFAAAQRSGNSQTWQVKIDGTVIQSYDPGSSASSYVDYSVNFVSASTTPTLAFVSTNLHGGDNTILIDNIRIVPGGGQPTVPADPSALAATATLPTTINLSWTDNANNETGFKVERKTGSGGTYAQIGTPSANATTYQDSTCSASTEYYYRVRATNAVGDSSYTGAASATTPAVPPATPAAPSSLAANATSSSQINLAWTDNANNETGFKVERKEGSGGSYAQVTVTGADATSFADSGLSPSTQYFYKVRATNGSGDSSFTSEVNATTQPIPTSGGNLQAVAFTNVQLSDPFWAQRIESNRTVSLPYMYQSFVTNGNLDNFPKTAGTMGGLHKGFPWADSDVYKTLEGMAYAIAYHPGGDSTLLNNLNSAVSNIAAAQRTDGYLDTYFQLGNQGRADDGGTLTTYPWQDPYSAHEDYCMGHMMEAAIAHYNLTGQNTFINVARNNADYLYNTIGVPPKLTVIPGHQEVELALFKLWKIAGIGKQADLDQAKYYLDERGRNSSGRPIYGEYSQDIYQVRNTTEPLGHVVRGEYMWAAAADVGNATNDPALLNASDMLWSNVVNKKMYVTGNVGHNMYNEGFAPDYDLSNTNIWGETCGACANMFWSQRLGNIRADSKYMDVLERVLYNGFAAGRSLDGSQLHYNNLMTRSGKINRDGIVCCATNLVRTVPTVSGYQYATAANDGIWTHLYMAGQAIIAYDGTNIGIQQTTNYPWDGNVTMTINPASQKTFSLHLRIPDWAAVGASATVNGQSVNMSSTLGYVTVQRTWNAGDVVQLTLPMNIRRIYMNSNVVADQGRVAIARGPMIYCLEGNDNPISVQRIVIPQSASLTASSYNSGDLGGIVRITGTGINADNGSGVNFTMIPYAVWDNRNSNKDSSLEVMIPESINDAVLKLEKSRAGNATVSYSYKPGNDSPGALNDGILPRNNVDSQQSPGAGDQSIPRLTFWNHFGTQEWVQYDFPSAITVNRSDMFWFDDNGDVSIPQSFTVQYWNGSNWQNVQLDSDYMNAVDLYAGYHFTIVRFVPVTTSKLRLLVQSKSGKSSGLLEWRVP